MSNGLMLALGSAETKVGICELLAKYLGKYQGDALTHDSIHCYGYSKLSHLGSAFLWNKGSPCRFESVGDRFDLLVDKL